MDNKEDVKQAVDNAGDNIILQVLCSDNSDILTTELKSCPNSQITINYLNSTCRSLTRRVQPVTSRSRRLRRLVKYGRTFILVLLNHISNKKVQKYHFQKKLIFRGGSNWQIF